MVELSALEGALPTDDDLDVTFWRVGDDRIAEDGHRVRDVPLSRKFSTIEEGREALIAIRVSRPNAYLVRHTIFFDGSDPADIAARKSLLDELRCGEASHG